MLALEAGRVHSSLWGAAALCYLGLAGGDEEAAASGSECCSTAPVPASPLASVFVEAAGCLTARAAAELPHGIQGSALPGCPTATNRLIS